MFALKEKKSLFGGTLRCAGLAAVATMASPAMADFVPALSPYGFSNVTSNYAYDQAGEQVAHMAGVNYVGGFAPPSFTYSTGTGGYLSAFAGPDFMSALAAIDDSGNWSRAIALTAQYFTVTSGKSAYVYWNLTNATDNSFIQVYQYGVGALIFEFAGSFGSMTLDLLPGETYAFYSIAEVDTAGTFAFGSMQWQVPAPGAMALLGLGMIGTRRRRRT